jgi:hypothetical protein
MLMNEDMNVINCLRITWQPFIVYAGSVAFMCNDASGVECVVEVLHALTSPLIALEKLPNEPF